MRAFGDRKTRIGRITAVGIFLAASAAAGVAAQSGLPRTPRFEAGIGAGVIVDYPRQFSDAVCELNAMSFGADALYRPISFLGIEGSISISGTTEAPCIAVDVSRAPTPIGVPVSRRRYPSEVRGATSFATDLALVVEPFSTGALGPRGRVGIGRLWNKDLGTWFFGAGVRYRFGRHSLIMDLERWMIAIDAFDEVVIYQATGAPTTVSSDPVTELERPYLVRVGWEFVIR